MEAVDVGAGRLRVGRPVGAQAEVAVADREQRAGQPAVVVTEAGLDQPPGVDREALAVDRDRRCSRRVTRASPRGRRRRCRRRPRRAPRGCRRGRRRSRARSCRRARRRRPRSRPRRRLPRAGATSRRSAACRNIAGSGLPARCCSTSVLPSTTATKRSSMPAARNTVRAFFDDDTIALGTPARSSTVHHRQRSRVGLDPLAGEHGVEHLVLAIAQRADRVVARRIGRVAPRQLDAAGRRGTSARRRSAAGRRRSQVVGWSNPHGANSSAHARSWISAVGVITPSRSNSTAPNDAQSTIPLVLTSAS